ncbi:hypothetical protein MATL_G00145080 [Megalops atlanticus]|uniref:Uncharacterized protein n=1 Tax=Megalops atlanticus TaxID=7932 RepID=A0A9D3PWK1_MEGAT|nr:hypothetical protein MATL_G00145080 [Megalops atlanticus]
MASMGASLDTDVGVPPKCPLCHQECADPTALRCGHCFCLACIQEVWSSSPTGPYYCPECREEYRKLPAFGRRADGPSTSAEHGAQGRRPSSPQGRANGDWPSTSGTSVRCHYCPSPCQQVAVKTCLVCGASMCSEHVQAHLESPVFQSHPLVAPTADISLWRCQEHQEMSKIYCRDCRVCACTVCTVIGAHRNHDCVGVAEAEIELRRNLKDDLKKMQDNEQAIQSTMGSLQEKKLSVQASLDEARAGLQQQYQAMREALEREEQRALQCVAREERRVLGAMQTQLDLLQDALGSFQKSLDILAELSDAKGAERVKEQAFIMEYNKISKSMTEMSNPVEELEPPPEVDHTRLAQLNEWAERRLSTVFLGVPDRDRLRLFYGITPSLNPDTAHPKLVLSEENRRVTYSEEAQPYPEQVARFSTFPQVLAATPRKGGRSYWEVEVTGEGRWKVAVCEALIARKGAKDACRIGFNVHSWCLFGERGKLEALHNKESTPVSESAPQRVGVFLDMEEGCVSFYSVAEGGALTLLHSFQKLFTQPLYPALAVSKSQLTFCHLF